MRKLVWLAILVAVLWSGYWAIAAFGIDRGLGVWLDARRGEGWQAEIADVSTAGFPARIDTRLSDLDLVDPDTGLGWSAPEFRFSTPLHAPTSVHVTWPETQRIVTPREAIDITAARMEGDLALAPGPDLDLVSGSVALDDIGLASSEGWTASLESASATGTRQDGAESTYDVFVAARNVRPPRIALRDLDPTGRLPELFDRLDLDATLGFDTPWDRHAIEDRRPQPTLIDLDRLTAKWGEMELEAAGSVTVDGRGVPEGQVTVRAVNWREMLALAEAGGWIPAELSPTVERGLEVLAGLSGNPNTIDAPLGFRAGLITIGPVPIGPAPVLRIR